MGQTLVYALTLTHNSTMLIHNILYVVKLGHGVVKYVEVDAKASI